MLLAKNQMALQQFDKAEASYLKARDIVDPKDQASLYFSFSRLYQRMGRTQDAIAMAEQAVSYNKKYYEAHFFLGSLFAVSGQYEQAESAFQKAIGGEDMINSKAYRHLANLAEWQDDRKKALFLYKKALEYNPNDFDTMMNIGTILAKSEEFDEAENIFRKALLIGNVRQIYRAYYNIGLVSLQQQDARAALDNLEKAYNLNPRNSGTLYALGHLYIDIGQLQEGKKLLEELLRLHPDHAHARIIKERIQKNPG
jgi:tetratricopeptide (TPR) repeat protein